MSSWEFSNVFLLTVNLWHLNIAAAFLHPIESPLKKPLVKHVSNICKALQRPVLTSSVIGVLLCIVSVNGYNYYQQHDNSVADPSVLRMVVGIYTTVCALCCMKFTSSLVKLGSDRFLDYELEIEKHDIVTFQPPPLSVVNALLAPQNAVMRPDVVGMHLVPKDIPSLFVMNHSLMGLDMGVFVELLYREKGFMVRGLADHFHFALPHATILKTMGAVNGTRANVDTLMISKQNILVYPGGSHEVMKHSNVPKYALLWKERLGFARMAIKHGYQIVPCACVGIEDMFDIVGDIPTPYKNNTIPIIKTSPGRLQKVYFWFGLPISTAEFNGDCENTDFARQVRDKTKAAIEDGIQCLRTKQEKDPERFIGQQLKAAMTSVHRKSDEKMD